MGAGLGGALALTAAVLGAGTSPAAADTSSRVALPSPNSSSLLAAGATTTPLDPATQLSLRVYLAPRPGLAAAAAAISSPYSPVHDRFLTASQYAAAFGTTSAQSTAVSDWLTSFGMTVTATTAHYLAVTATVAQADTAFDTQVSQYSSASQGWNDPGVVGGFSVPAALAGDVQSVTGIDQLVLPPPSGTGKTAKKTLATKARTAKATTRAASTSTPQCSQYWGQYTGSIPEAFGHTTAPTAMCGYTPNQIRDAYGISSSPYTGKGTTIAVISTANHPTMAADANQYFASHGETGFAPGQFSDYFLPTEAASCAGIDLEPDPEEPIDVESAHIGAPDAKIVNVATDCDQSGNDGAFLQESLDGVSAVVDGHLADIVSGSFGIPEPGDAPADMVAWDPILEQGAVEGITFDFSSGDGGDAGATTYDVHNAQFPATDPWVTAIGGTSTAIGADGHVLAEYPWGDNFAQIDTAGTGYTDPAPPGTYFGGSGGGVSSQYAEPWYQQSVVPTSLATDGGIRASRVMPDISADAGLSWDIGWTGAVTDGTYNELAAGGGTSASAPLIAGLEADAIQAAGHPLGFVNPSLYALSGSTAIHDVLPVDPADPPIMDGEQTDFAGVDYTQVATLGEDVGLTATAGYDDVTGLGTPTTSFVSALAGG
jgi:subtilase family serine protease